jgi:hypothetical protein
LGACKAGIREKPLERAGNTSGGSILGQPEADRHWQAQKFDSDVWSVVL